MDIYAYIGQIVKKLVELTKYIVECQQFLEFLGDLRYNNNNIPLLVGGDFNMDMKVCILVFLKLHVSLFY